MTAIRWRPWSASRSGPWHWSTRACVPWATRARFSSKAASVSAATWWVGLGLDTAAFRRVGGFEDTNTPVSPFRQQTCCWRFHLPSNADICKQQVAKTHPHSTGFRELGHVRPRGPGITQAGDLTVSPLQALVPRYYAVDVEAMDPEGKPLVMRASGWRARILQHECDHLQGILYVDRMWPTTLAATENLPQWARAIPAGVMGRCTCHHPVDRLWQPGHPTPMPVTTLTDTSTTTATTSPVKGSG
ncbi:hypothetical protein Vafri_978 [Volvox africanus]|nr:hypothetical protein Vafri_978 [Volvox africanus]